MSSGCSPELQADLLSRMTEPNTAPSEAAVSASVHASSAQISARGAGLIAAASVLVALLIVPVDAALVGVLSRLGERMGGDLRRELLALQQYGGLGSIILMATGVWLLHPAGRRRLLDFAAATVLTGIAVFLGKVLIGRPRPKFDDPFTFLGPWGTYPVSETVGLRHSWELGSGISSDLWSMPSSHTAHAVTMSVFLAVAYPRLRPLAVALAVVVAACRPLFDAHWVSDVVVGAGAAFAVSWCAVSRQWGVRSLDWFWKRFVDPNASPAFRGH